ncbi:polysaccharide deacetylase family protein [Flavobacterium sp.]|jgi:peptidoglycan/xylan/chitin deacetylase (PgdA/CDA1 family)|uniref:polysaccharide deacetylase family protein n=1 Tax=Flavobacterium sp. TaxID=239 RepID=UPI0022BE19F7|nr:polysaccharide deacetylase family protein [Flavobacterium sp.]MCZ8230099.1 polysaccharide deacetylase family protein [Flavobacterium sp.]
MSFYWIKTNALIKTYFSNYIWDIPNKNNCIYLTFDDGPTPEVTNWVLNLLKKENIKATFFCIGKNIQAQPELFKQIVNEGHTVGNHTNDHYNGWKNSEEIYIENTKKCDAIITLNTGKQPYLFRPPYGRIKRGQAKKIKELGYKIIMWDVLSADFDTQITPEKCLNNVISSVQPGSIIVFHDSLKAEKNLKYTLPKTINYLKQKGFTFEVIPR